MVLCRQLEDDVVVGGYLVPKGSIAVLCHHTMSNSEEYVANPRTFCPERWIKSSPQYVSYGLMNFKDTELYVGFSLKLTDFAAMCFPDFIDWRYIHSWFVFSTRLVNCFCV